MKVKALTPDLAHEMLDNLVDVETETVVATINCILVREYRNGGVVEIPLERFGNQEIQVQVFERFIAAGWKIDADTSFNRRKLYFRRYQ